jgi:hypothetical protein
MPQPTYFYEYERFNGEEITLHARAGARRLASGPLRYFTYTDDAPPSIATVLELNYRIVAAESIGHVGVGCFVVLPVCAVEEIAKAI